MTVESNAERHRKMVAAMDAGDMERFTSYLAENTVLHVPGTHGLGGEHHGPHAVMSAIAKLYEITGGTLRAERIDVMASDERTFGLARFTARRDDGRELDTYVGSLLRWQDGQCVEDRTLPLDPEAFYAFHA